MQLFERLFERSKLPDNIKEYGLTALIKLYAKYPSSKNRIVDLIETQQTSSGMEVQKRACEYIKLVKSTWDANR